MISELWKRTKQAYNTTLRWGINHYREWRKPKLKPHNIDFLYTARQQLLRIQQLSQAIGPQWQEPLSKAIIASDDLLRLCEQMPKQADRTRRFFKVSLDSLEQLTAALCDIQTNLNPDERKKTTENILLIRDEALRNKTKLVNKRHFDFQVMMETIKQRHK